MNRQEAFDLALNTIRTQGKPSRGRNGFCMYRGPNGTKCAIGALLTDAEALKVSSTTTIGFWDLLPTHIQDLGASFLINLQLAHDNAAAINANNNKFLDDFEEAMSRVAKAYNLVMS